MLCVNPTMSRVQNFYKLFFAIQTLFHNFSTKKAQPQHHAVFVNSMNATYYLHIY